MRNLERRLADICRKAAAQVAKGKAQKMRVDDRKLREWLGPRRFSGEVRKRTADAGRRHRARLHGRGRRRPLHRGDRVPGQGQPHADRPARRRDGGVGAGGALVGALARRELGVAEDWFEKHDVHIHVPAGAVPKDGPSAGVTMATAIASLIRGEPVRRRRRHDGRDHAHRPGAADRRHPREVARRAARRPQARDLPARERERPRRPAAGDARGAHVRPGRHDRGRAGARLRPAGAGAARHDAPLLCARPPRRPVCGLRVRATD